MAAPAPVSALLHAVAVVKAGAFGILRMIYDVYGIDTVSELGLGTPLALWAGATILYGSFRAVMQTDIKKRLAYSTVSQVSYIILGASLIGPFAIIGGLVHLVHQGIMKITLFMCAGALDNRMGIKLVADLDGAGRAMPVTMAAFSIGALGMIGIPPTAGFISKWYLGMGGLQSEASWVIAVLAGSSLLGLDGTCSLGLWCAGRNGGGALFDGYPVGDCYRCQQQPDRAGCRCGAERAPPADSGTA